ncbi:hypothetical protein AAFF_G00265430 [Aldrovandia affinis]|uniref:Uncharacterized protein n=1 Tax=Aldrovandia affinis TaxID=143900 RepID=A0AAD7RBJ3_9TELE|nr:hypothetical protein AAFF_G00265430 [Aldrovandia affinis]
MSDRDAFRTRLASIMEILAESAVAEICKLVDDGYAILRFTVSQSQEENKTLKRKLQMMAFDEGAQDSVLNNRYNCAPIYDTLREATVDYSISSCPAEGGVFGMPLGSQRRDGQAPDVDESDRPMLHVIREDKCAGVEEGKTESLPIKKERLEEDSDPHGEMNIREKGHCPAEGGVFGMSLGSQRRDGQAPDVDESDRPMLHVIREDKVWYKRLVLCTC